jgi:hypothetical protein
MLRSQDYEKREVTTIYGSLVKAPKTVWFRAITENHNSSEHDWFGNICCTIPTEMILQRSFYFHLVDRVMYQDSAATRIVISKKILGLSQEGWIWKNLARAIRSSI